MTAEFSKPSISARIFAAAGIFLTTGAAVFLWFFNPSTAGFFPACPLLATTGFACPGCGMTRGFHALLHGDIVAALGFNALLPVYVFVFAYLFAALFLLAVRGRLLDFRIFHPTAIYGFLIVSLVFAVVRNLPVYPFTLLYP